MIEVGRPPDFEPSGKPQKAMLDSIGVIDLLLYGGAAGSTKTHGLLVDASQEYQNPNLHALILRKTFKEIELDMEPKSHAIYTSMGAKYNTSKRRWEWPWGAAVQFGYVDNPGDVYRYYGTEFSYIGFDESTFHTEEVVRHMMFRLRSKDPSLKLRVRLATNPGNVGGEWHKQIFMGPHCTHCLITPESRLPFKIYRDGTWPSDGMSIVGSDGSPMSTCFIPGRLTDHNLLAGYENRLKGLPERLRRALLEGCWESWEGQYYTCWNPQTHLTSWRSTDNQIGLEHVAKWWWTYWVGCDYGFGSSRTAAYLMCKSPEGMTYVVDEVLLQHTDAPSVATYLKNRWADWRDKDGNSREIQAWYLSPDSWASRGLKGDGGNSIAEQMQNASQIPWEQASNDRCGGAMLIYSQLAGNKLLVCTDTCPNLIKTLPSRVHDPNRPEDVLKVAGDPYDDCYDGFRYADYSFAQTPRKPKTLLIAESITSADPTGAHMQWVQARRKFDTTPKVFSYRGSRVGRA